MLLTFTKKQFIERAIAGVKTTTFREDVGKRWKPGVHMHGWYGNPRNTRAEEKPYYAFDAKCGDVLPALIFPLDNAVWIQKPDGWDKITGDRLEEVAIRDGFDTWAEMRAFFEKGGQTWRGYRLSINDVKEVVR